MMDNSIKKIIFLGCGTSTGVPVLGCNCQVCQSSEIKNKRLRSSILVQLINDKNILIDAGPDLRAQLLREKITHIDACIITHEHADHVHGLDDLRPFSYFNKKNIPVYTSPRCAKLLKNKFSYIFDKEKNDQNAPKVGGGIPLLHLCEVEISSSQPTFIESIPFYFLELQHGPIQTLGIFNDQFAYLVDCHEISIGQLAELKKKNPQHVILDCVKRKKHSTHLHLELSLNYLRLLSCDENYLTHLGDDFDFENLTDELKAELPLKIQVAFDGMIISSF